MQNETNDPSGREQTTSVLLDAPVEFVWRVWTEPGHIKQWWGPTGFTNTIHKMDVKVGGEWVFTMHGPDGKDYPNKTIFKEVVLYDRIVHEHVNPNFIAIIRFKPQDHKTLLSWYKLYETKELFTLIEQQHKANEGLMQTIERLKIYLHEQQAKAV